MARNTSKDGSLPPTKRRIEALLGRASAHWARLHGELTSDFGPLAEKWSWSSKTERWSVQIKRRKGQRTVLYLVPLDGHFQAALVLGERACRAALECGLPEAVLEAIEAAPRYPEGRGVRLEVRTRRDAEIVRKLAAVKMAH